MQLSATEKKQVIKEFAKSEKDVGSTEVQVAILTKHIQMLTAHVKEHPKDNHSRYGLINLVSKRKRLMKYLKRKSLEAYQQLISRLSLRDAF